jgi:hypothetical protein
VFKLEFVKIILACYAVCNFHPEPEPHKYEAALQHFHKAIFLFTVHYHCSFGSHAGLVVGPTLQEHTADTNYSFRH